MNQDETEKNGVEIFRGSAVGLLEEATRINEKMEFLNSYANMVRENLLESIRNRSREIQKHGELAACLMDPYLQHLKVLKDRFVQVEAILKGLLASQGGELTATNFEHAVFGIESLMGIELEARASQARIAQSAVLEGYVTPRNLRPEEIQIEVEKTVRQQFQILHDRVKASRESEYGLVVRFSDEDLVGLLISIGISNMKLLANLRLPETDRVRGAEPIRIIKFNVDARVFEQFHLLTSGVNQIRWQIGSEALDANAIFSLLVGLGNANVNLLAAVGVPNLMAVPFSFPTPSLREV